MPTLKEYFATAKLTPQDRGATAWEQAGRRISAYAEQTAQGDRQLGKDIADLWNEAKFGPDVLRAENEPGRGGGVRTGTVHDALDFGRPFGADRGANGPDTNESSPGPNAGGYYNSRAAANIGRAAATLPQLVQRLMDGQGLTDQQYQQLSNTSGGRTALFNARNAGGASVVYDPKKGGVAPNPDVTDEEAAKAGFNVDSSDQNPSYLTYGGPNKKNGWKYGDQIPDYPSNSWSPRQYGPPMVGMDKNGVRTTSNIPGGSPLDPSSSNYVGTFQDPSQTQGAQNWSAIQATQIPSPDGDVMPGIPGNIPMPTAAPIPTEAPPRDSGEEPTNALQ